MKTFLAFFVLLTLAALSSGCTRSSANPQPMPEPVPASVYKAGRGLQFSTAAVNSMGVTTVDVAPRAIKSALASAAVPAEALLRTVKGDFVYVINGGWYLRTPVVTGPGDGAWFQVDEGLYEGDQIVAHGARSIWLAELQAINGGVGCADGH